MSLTSSIPLSEDDEEQCGEGEETGEGDAGQLSDISESFGELQCSSGRLGNPNRGSSAITGGSRKFISI